MEHNQIEPITVDTNAPGMVILNRNPGSSSDEGNQSDPNSGSLNLDSHVSSVDTEDIRKILRFRASLPKCQPEIVLFMKNFVKKVNLDSGQLLSKIKIPGTDPFVSVSSFLGSTMEELYQLHSFIDGKSKPHTADANAFFEHSFPNEYKDFTARK